MDESPTRKRRRAGTVRLYDQEQPDQDQPAVLGVAAEGDREPPAPPPVVAVIVTNGGPRLERTLASLRAQDYPTLGVLVIDAGSPADPTARIAAHLPTAYVRRLGHDPGFGAAANEAMDAVEGAPFLLFCRDTVTFDDDAVRVLVDEAFRSNAGIVGPKIVDADHPEVLLHVGLAVDKFGSTYSGIEPGELDQEQHDAVRDVFYVPSGALLVRSDLFRTLGGFDADLGDAGEDLDLCWRARVAGARVLVVPDARAHQPAADLRIDDERRRRENRNRVRTLLKAYSLASLLRVLPQAAVVTIFEALVLLGLGRRAQAGAAVDAWVWNLRRLRAVGRGRSATQAVRAVGDGDIRFLQISGSARARDFVLGRIEHGGRARSFVRTGREIVDATTERVRWTVVAFWVAALGIPLFGVRELVTGRVPSVGSLLRWPGVAPLVRDFVSSWRFSGLGSATPAPPGLAVMAGAGVVTFGAAGLARTLVVAAAIPVGMIAAYRLGRGQGLDTVPSAAVAVAYGVNPVVRNAIANGRLGAIVLFAAAPFIVHRILAATAVPRDRRRGRSVVLPLALVTALLSAIYPPAAALGPLAALALVLAAPVAGATRSALVALGYATAASALAFVLLLPWSLSLVLPGSDPASAALAFRPGLSVGDLLRFHTGPAGGGRLGLSLLLAAAFPLAVVGRTRLALAVRGWALAVAGFAVAYIACQRWAGGPWPAPEAMLVPAALGLALAIGAGVATLVHELPRSSFGWRHVAVGLTGVGVVLASLSFVAASASGRYGLPSRDWASSLSWMDATSGEFRVLWAGDPGVLPLDAWTLGDGVGYGLSRNGASDARVLWPISADGTTGLVADALRDAMAGRTNRLGHVLAPMSVRYIAVPLRRAPDANGVRVRVPALTAALAAQTDLAQLVIDRDLVLYQNTSWFPAGALAAPSSAGIESALTSDLADAPSSLRRRNWRGASGRVSGRGTLLWSETYDRQWTARAGGRTLPHRKAFGWANAFPVTRDARVTVRHRGLPLRWAGIVLEAALWIVAVRWWRRERRRVAAADVPPSPPPAAVDVGRDHSPSDRELSALDLPLVAHEELS